MTTSAPITGRGRSNDAPRLRARGPFVALAALAACALSGCANLASNAMAGLGRDLTAGVLNQDDPQTVADGLPAYLLLLDGLLEGDPGNDAMLLAASRLNGAYAGGFVDDAARRTQLSRKSLDLARRATCAREPGFCAALDADFERYDAAVARLGPEQLELAYALASAWAGVVQADSGDLNRIAELPKIESLFRRIVALDRGHDHGGALMYLGVLSSLRPESLGGTPAAGREAFEAAIEVSGGNNQMARVLYAEYYARLTFDQALHDRLLEAVIAADPKAPGLTLANVLAQRRARVLLESGQAYF
ncbi:MAG TPA: TRAP transporter TatT component family protein [Candidatus Saccharimonadia bacterium]|nr:TRAP transporter TatT component family protein [Candidatus Saccharimonadia bacterium]